MKIIQVLLVEDDPMVREVNRQFIERVEGFKVIDMASDGIKGIEKIKSLTPDLVVMDIFMPEQDGIETLRQIRQQNLNVDCIFLPAVRPSITLLSVHSCSLWQRVLCIGNPLIMSPSTS